MSFSRPLLGLPPPPHIPCSLTAVRSGASWPTGAGQPPPGAAALELTALGLSPVPPPSLPQGKPGPGSVGLEATRDLGLNGSEAGPPGASMKDGCKWVEVSGRSKAGVWKRPALGLGPPPPVAEGRAQDPGQGTHPSPR